MKVRLVCVGKLSASFLKEGCAEYHNRLRRYLPLDLVELKEEKASGKKANTDLIKSKEGERILGKIPEDAYAVVLDERGRTMTSQELAAFLDRHMVNGTPELSFVIGGAYGLSDPVKKRADRLLSLSPMTLTHQMARLLLLEQLYRGMTIVRNEPYHNN